MIILEHYEGGACQMVEIETFAGFFGSVLDDEAQVDKYEALKTADGEKGYTPFFDRWHELGII